LWSTQPKRRVFVILAIISLVTAGIFVVGFCGSGACGPGDGDVPPTEPSSAPPSTPSPTTPNGAAKRPFQNPSELQAAIDEYLTSDNPELSEVAGLYGYPIGSWNVSLISNFSSLFDTERNNVTTSFDEDLSEWDMSNAATLQRMFYNALQFNSPLNNWDVSRVTDMAEMFSNCGSFNGAGVSNWDTRMVVSMESMFHNATSCK
jgi:surface protein